MLSIQFKGVEIMKMPNTREYLKHHTPRKTGGRAWKIIDELSGRVVDSYTPEKKKK